MEENRFEKSQEKSESSEEMRALIDRYHNLLIDREKEHAALIGERAGSTSTSYFLRRNASRFFYALIIEAGFRLAIVVALWLAIFSVGGFSGWSLSIMSISVISYGALEALEIVSKMKLVTEVNRR